MVRDLLDGLWLLVRIAFAALAAFLLFNCIGCSATEQLAGNVNDVRSEADGIRQDAQSGQQALDRGDAGGAHTAFKSIDARATRIQGKTAEATKLLTKVTDRVPLWVSVLKLALWTLLGLAIAAVVVCVAWRLDGLVWLETFLQGVATKLHGLLGKVMGA